MQKNVDDSVQWERDAAAAIPMAIPILLLAESIVSLTRDWTGLDSLTSLASNRVTYSLLFVPPVWLVVFLGFRRINRKQPAKLRWDALFAKSTPSYRWSCLAVYFLVPIAIFVIIFFG